MGQVIKKLTVSGVEAIPLLTGGETDPYTLTKAYTSFSLQFKFANTPSADPLIYLEGSNDGTTWSNIYTDVSNPATGDATPIKVLMTGAFSDTTDGVDSVSGSNIPFERFRVVIEASAGNPGTVEITLNLEEIE